MGYFIKKDKHGNEGFVIPSGPTAERPTSPTEAIMRYNTDTQSIEYFNGTVFVDIAKTGDVTPTIDKLTTIVATADVTMSKAPGDETKVMVFLDGVHQTSGASKHYTTAGTTLSFTSIPPTGLQVTVIHDLFGTYVPNANVFDVPNL